MKIKLSQRLTKHRDIWLYKEWEESKNEFTMSEIAESRKMTVQQVSQVLKSIYKDKWLIKKVDKCLDNN